MIAKQVQPPNTHWAFFGFKMRDFASTYVPLWVFFQIIAQKEFFVEV